MSLTAGELEQVRGLADPIQLSEVADIYLPLSRLLRLYFEASAGLRETVGAFLGQRIRPAPFIIAVAGSVAVGKSTTARVLQDADIAVAANPAHRTGHDRQLPVSQRGAGTARPGQPQGLPRVI